TTMSASAMTMIPPATALAGWAVAGGIIVIALALIVVAFVPAIREVVGALQAGLDALRSGTGGVRLPPELASTADQASAAITGWVKDDLGELAGRVSMTATIAILSTFLTFFVLLDADHGADWALQGVDPADRDALRLRGRDAAMRVGGLVRSTAVASAVRAGVMLVAMLALGTPFAGPLAAVLLVGGLVPYLGTLVATTLVLLVAVGGQGMGYAALLLAVAVAIDVALARVRGRAEASGALRVHPAVALLALPIGAVAAGLIGMIVAVPVAAFVAQMTGTALAAFEPRLPATSSAGPEVPGWLDRLAQWSWRLLVGIGLLAALVVLTVALSGPVLAVVLAAVLAATLAPAASPSGVGAWGPPRPRSAPPWGSSPGSASSSCSRSSRSRGTWERSSRRRPPGRLRPPCPRGARWTGSRGSWRPCRAERSAPSSRSRRCRPASSSCACSPGSSRSSSCGMAMSAGAGRRGCSSAGGGARWTRRADALRASWGAT
ncbi:MAG: AI-2E family transporter, partial [Chloroflexota bacterium]